MKNKTKALKLLNFHSGDIVYLKDIAFDLYGNQVSHLKNKPGKILWLYPKPRAYVYFKFDDSHRGIPFSFLEKRYSKFEQLIIDNYFLNKKYEEHKNMTYILFGILSFILVIFYIFIN